MKFSWNRLALLVGAFVLALTAIDGLLRMHESAMADFGSGHGPLVAADSAMALFLVGLVVGMVLGIGVFFGYLVWRERRFAEEPDEVSLLLEEVAAEERRSALHREREDVYGSGDEKGESLDPWERPADWWKKTDED
jgi:hypothetical protein